MKILFSCEDFSEKSFASLINRARARSPFAVHRRSTAIKRPPSTHAKLKSILTFAVSAPLW